MKGIENKKSSLQLEKIIVEDLSFKRINNEKSKIDNNSEISFSKQLNQIDESLYKVTVGVHINSNDVCNIKVN